MTKQMFTAFCITLGCMFISFTSNAEDKADSSTSSSTGSSTDSATDSISKESWLKSVTPLLPDLICKGFQNDPQLKKRLDEIKMTFEQCVAKIPDSVSKCQQDIYASIPEKITNDNAGVWGKALGECIGKDFAIKYLVPKS
ncbi:hypothetical protein LEAN103870_10195 [Legionella anisa]|uniref:T2SS substrate NttA domain-containing protein n=1 Tax=Legionella anisa TaxID=28082 RepID=A0AAX0WWF6_9GAMM|nr:hypothetical protein [Legionella anisa]AWN74468.1 hypothetical protein DLD14_11755 [Legionella anisa]KTC71840.1 hypothetical protein Lani_1432 [Legionella anisa]MBN5935372.1 hypothetical protein [Legionella anisa]MCW8425425.1 hypothetical protein [Legionella anisa]MCW8449144.1 hypothetical protein [Legionella anisa]